MKPLRAIIVLVAALMVWLAGHNLPWPARLFTTLLLTGLPALAIAQVRALLAMPTPLPRSPIYISSIISLWLLAVLTLIAAIASGYTAPLIGLRSVAPFALIGWTFFGLIAAGLLYAITRWLGYDEARLLVDLLPQTAGERLMFVLVSISAGVCEELVFRGFLIPTLTVIAGEVIIAALLASALFAVLHSYQSWLGVIRAGILGAVLTVPFVVSGSILPSMLSHTLIDIIGGLWLGREAPRAATTAGATQT